MAQAVDYSYSHPSPWEIVNAGYVGVLRYSGWDFGSGPRCISKPEYDALRAAGLAVDIVWETTADMVMRGGPGGRADGQKHAQNMRAIGHNNDCYVAIDFGITPQQQPTADAYLDAFKQSWMAEFYGHYGVIEHTGTGWQCCAWSGMGSGTGGSLQGRRVSKGARIYQLLGYVVHNSCDANEILGGKGNFQIGTDAPATKPATQQPSDGGVAWQPSQVLEGTVTEVQQDLTFIAQHDNDPRMDPKGVDGIWGENTRNAVVWFQRQFNELGTDHRLADDGIVGHATISSLRFVTFLYALTAPQNPDEPTVPPRVPQDPETPPAAWYPPVHPAFPGGLYKHQEPDLIQGDVVRQIQEQLHARDAESLDSQGFVIDGVFGQQTEDVVRQFQREHAGAPWNLEDDGIVGEQTWNAMYEAPTS